MASVEDKPLVLRDWCRSEKGGCGRETARARDVVNTRGSLAGAISDWSHATGYRDWCRVWRLDTGAECERLEGRLPGWKGAVEGLAT